MKRHPGHHIDFVVTHYYRLLVVELGFKRTDLSHSRPAAGHTWRLQCTQWHGETSILTACCILLLWFIHLFTFIAVINTNFHVSCARGFVFMSKMPQRRHQQPTKMSSDRKVKRCDAGLENKVPNCSISLPGGFSRAVSGPGMCMTKVSGQNESGPNSFMVHKTLQSCFKWMTCPSQIWSRCNSLQKWGKMWRPMEEMQKHLCDQSNLCWSNLNFCYSYLMFANCRQFKKLLLQCYDGFISIISVLAVCLLIL